MVRRPPSSTLTATLLPDTALFRSLRLEFGGAGVDRLVDRPHAELVAQRAHLGLGNAAGHRLDRFVDQPGAVRDAARAIAQMRRLERQRSEEHTSELQSLMRISYAVFCLKKTNKIYTFN